MKDPIPAPPLIAIDGPSGVGKGTVARLLAERLGSPYFDTGAMYRAAALAVLDAGVDPADAAAAVATVLGADLGLTPRGAAFEVLLDGCPVEERIRTPEVTRASSVVSAYPEVRRRLVELQRMYGRRFGGVMEGRDIGTRVFPDTPFKFFLDADPDERVDRRVRQLRERGDEVSREAVARDMAQRDERDRTRADSPLTWDETYRRVDTTHLSADEVTNVLVEAISEIR